MTSRLLPLVVQFSLGVVLACIPFCRVAGYKSMLVVGLITTFVLPMTWLSKTRAKAGMSWAGGCRYVALAILPAAILLVAGMAFTKGCEVSDGIAMITVGMAPGAALSYVTIHALGRRWLYAIVWVALLLAAALTFLDEPVYRTAHPMTGMLLGPPNEKPEVLSPLAFWFAAEVLSWTALVASTAIVSRRWRERAADSVGRLARLAPPFATLLVAASVLLWLRTQDADLGYRIDRTHIQAELRATSSQGGLTHYMSPRIPTDARPWLALDAEFERASQRELLGLAEKDTPRSTIYWYKDRNEKRRLTGAGRTKFAKVHLGEFAVTADRFPARTLNHEMSHVTSAAFSNNTFEVPGALGGLWYNPGLVEGFAVAVAWTDYPLSAHERARIAVDKGRAPAPDELFTPLGFATTNLSVAYRVAGSFVRFCMDTYGVQPVLRWYETENFDASMGVPISDAKEAWMSMLMTLEIREQDRRRVDDIQSRPPITAESCGTAQDELDLRSAFAIEADDEVQRLLDARPQTAETWFTRKKYEAQRSNYGCEFPDVPPMELSQRDARRYEWLRAMGAWTRGDTAHAETIFAKLPATTRATNSVVIARTVMRSGFRSNDLYLDAPVDAAQHYQEIYRRTGHPIFGYLRARQLRKGQRWHSLDELMTGLDFGSLKFPDAQPGTVLLEVHDMRGQAAFARRRWDAAAGAFEEFKRIAPTEGRVAYAETWLKRIAHFRAHEGRLEADLPRL